MPAVASSSIAHAIQQADPERADALFEQEIRRLHSFTDRLFAGLMAFQMVGGILLAVFVSPTTWIADTSYVHIHLWAAIGLGTLLSSLPILLGFLRPGETSTRYVIAIAQTSWSALLIHLSGGRIETHFHIFCSLAFLSFYRDWKVIATATTVVALDHYIRGVYWPESVFGVVLESPYRWLEHAAWVGLEDFVLILACLRGTQDLRETCERRVSLEQMNESVEQVVAARTAELSEANRQLSDSQRFLNATIDSLSSRIAILGSDGLILATNANWRFANDGNPFANATIFENDDYLVKCREPSGMDEGTDLAQGLQAVLNSESNGMSLEYTFDTEAGQKWFSARVTHFRTGRDLRVVVAHQDITELKSLEGQLVHAQKLEACGQLAAGIAHEINTPIQYIGDNARFLKESSQEVLDLLAATIEMVDRTSSGEATEDDVESFKKRVEEADVEYLVEEIPVAIDQSIEGVDRVARIVRAMKEFSHPGCEDKMQIDLNKAISSTVTIATNEWKYVADVVQDLDQNLPPVPCLPGELNQVILNLLINASHAIGDVVGENADERGTIRISTSADDSHAEIRISDTGSGIPPEVQSRIFDPFFTTKEVGKGTGQGLSIAHSIIKERHGGDISFETAAGQGTTFVIHLPL